MLVYEHYKQDALILVHKILKQVMLRWLESSPYITMGLYAYRSLVLDLSISFMSCIDDHLYVSET